MIGRRRNDDTVKPGLIMALALVGLDRWGHGYQRSCLSHQRRATTLAIKKRSKKERTVSDDKISKNSFFSREKIAIDRV